MSRRTLTLFLASVLALGLAVAGGASSVPYVALSAGPTFDTLGTTGDAPVLTITGAKTYPTDGTLSLTTVSVTDNLSLFEAILGWLSPTRAVIPREIVYPPDRTPEQERQENAQQMVQSQDDATTAALRELGIPATVVVGAVGKGLPAEGQLRVGDVLTAVDGKPVRTVASVGRYVRTHKPGEPVTVSFTRGGAARTVTLMTVRSTDKPVRAVIGISPNEKAFSVKVEIKLMDVGGPSAGLMFALGIIDKLGPESLTGGRKIAGTGEIDGEGQVGQIGGIAEKLLGARKGGATVFLTPAKNCDEAKATVPDGLRLVKVETLHGALEALQALRDGGTPPSC